MGARKEVVRKMASAGMCTTKALWMAQIPRSTYYYQPRGLRRGKAPSTRTLFKGKWVSNERVISAIHNILGEEFIDYGYIRTAEALRSQGFIINKKKVYRIMKQQRLLYPYKPCKSHKKEYVCYSSPIYSQPFEALEMDFKYVYIDGPKRNAYLISIQDIFSRMCLEWDLNWDMKTNRALELLNKLQDIWLVPYGMDPRYMTVKIRTDNGSQFIARLFTERLNDAHILNEYIHPGTPQQNGHIESLHNTIEKLVCKPYVFQHLEQARETFKRFFHTYNNKRIMKSILYHTPAQFLRLWYQNKIVVQTINRKIIYTLSAKQDQNNHTISLQGELVKQNAFNKVKILT